MSNLTHDEILQKLRPLIADELCVDAQVVSPQSRFVEDLGADSLDVIELVMRAEEEFEIEIADEETEKVTTVDSAAAMIARLLKANSSSTSRSGTDDDPDED